MSKRLLRSTERTQSRVKVTVTPRQPLNQSQKNTCTHSHVSTLAFSKIISTFVRLSPGAFPTQRSITNPGNILYIINGHSFFGFEVPPDNGVLI